MRLNRINTVVERSVRSDDAATEVLRQRLRGVVLLSGTLRATPLGAAIARSHLDLPLRDDTSLLGGWRAAVDSLAQVCNLDHLNLRVLLNQRAPRPVSAVATQRVRLTLEEDRKPLRGTAGILRDVIDDYADDDLLLVANGAQVMLQPLHDVATALAARKADVSLVANDNGTPCGLMLVSCGVMRNIASRGFVDMKEQALPAIARDHDVAVVRCDPPAGLPARTLPDYIRALRWHHRWAQSGPVDLEPFAESWQCTFSIVEPGAHIHPTARVHDSVVLSGATVEAGAVLVQSVVGPGATIKAKQTIADSVVGSAGGGA